MRRSLSVLPPRSLPPRIGREGLRVVMLSDAIRSRNGVGTYYDDLLEHLRERVGRVELFSPSPVELERGWSFSMPGDATQKVCVPDYRNLYRKVQRIRPHVIVAATPGPYGLTAVNLAYRMGVKLCVAYHAEYGKLVSLYWRHWLGRLCRRTIDGVDRLMFRSSSAVLVNNAALMEAVRENGGRDVRLVGTPVPRIFLESSVEPIQPELRSVAYVGRLAPEKEVGAVIEAARSLPGIRFRLVGDGPLMPQLRRDCRALPNVELLGWRPREGVREVLDASDLLVLPSRLETFGTVALEAMARGRLVMVSRHCGIVHWDELAGGLVCVEDDESLEMAIRRVAAMPWAERTRRARHAREAAVRLHEATLTHWLEVLDSLGGRGRIAA